MAYSSRPARYPRAEERAASKAGATNTREATTRRRRNDIGDLQDDGKPGTSARESPCLGEELSEGFARLYMAVVHTCGREWVGSGRRHHGHGWYMAIVHTSAEVSRDTTF